MKRIVMLAVLGLLAVLGVMAATQANAAPEAAATLKSLRGTAVIERAGKALSAKAGDALYEQDRLKTGPESYLGLGFTDQSLLSVGPNSDVNLAKYRFDRTTHQGEQQLGIKSGSLSAISGKIAKASPEQVRFNTGTVTLGVRGTEFLIDVGYVAPCAPRHFLKDGLGASVMSGSGDCVRMNWEDEHAATLASDLFYLLPDRDGVVGAISLRGDGVTLDVDKAYAGGAMGRGRLQADQSSAQVVNQRYGQLLAALPAGARTYTVKFVAGRADALTPASEQALASIRQAITDWPDVPDVNVVGHTDTVGSLQGNDALSLKRAATIRALLIKLGVPAARVHMAGRGERQPLVSTADGVAEEANRRVEITIY